MKAMEAINQADRLRPNAYSAEEKLRWLERLEERIRREIPAGDEAQNEESFGPERELLAPAAYEELYLHFLCARMSLGDGEADSFNAANALFEAVYGSFRNARNRERLPKTARKRYF